MPRHLLILLTLLATAITQPAHAADAAHAAENRSVVVWISIDGLRPDYLDRAQTPTFDRLIREGAHTNQLKPAFPSLTFPTHTAQVTGATVSRHGIPANSFFDAETHRAHIYPQAASLIQAETIWQTASRQGVRAMVHYWPVSHRQSETDHEAAVWLEGFDPAPSDRQRLQRLLDAWQDDERNEPPLRLLMTWTGELDKVGHSAGPNSDAIAQTMAETDELFGWFLDQVLKIWETQYEPGDQLYLLMSTDHGMSEVHTLVNFEVSTGIDWREQEGVRVFTSGNVANVYVGEIDDAVRRREVLQAVENGFADADYASVYPRDALPPNWAYDHPWRVGDLIVVLETGYTFSRRPEGPTGDAEALGGPLGMHGYDPAEEPEMMGLAVVWRHPNPIAGRDLGPIDSRQFHATVARWLNIKPAPHALDQPILPNGPRP